MALIDFKHWEAFYAERVEGLEPYDHYDEGYRDAMDAVDDWLDSYIPVDPVACAGGCYCRKCGHWHRYTVTNRDKGTCRRGNVEMGENDFCSKGRRREGEKKGSGDG